jgi:uncharacterized protein YjbJ (UPF0337 family)
MFDGVQTGHEHATNLALASWRSMQLVEFSARKNSSAAATNRRRVRMLDWQFRQAGSAQKEFAMNRDIVAGNWKQFKGRVKAQWGRLTGRHLDVIDGKGVELSGKVQEGYGVTKDVVEQQIERSE